ncbi:MAG TPA: DUF885 domain-containing protein [Bryobacteraceae bacterium]|nr:DUF885 domain-containing protein [Bryobacteraceae bacterium]
MYVKSSIAPFCAALLWVIAVSCGTPRNTGQEFDKLTSDFVYGSLALSPSGATQAGYHTHNGAALDEMFDDFSPTGIQAQHDFFTGMQSRMSALDAKSLDKEQAADVEIMKNNIGLSLLDLDSIQSYKHNPTMYVELAGNALFECYMLNYAPVEKRFEHIAKRLEKMPALFDQAKANLTDAPEVWNRVAQEENQGNIDLIDKTLRAAAPEARKAAYGKAAGPAITALRDFNTFLKGTLSKKTSDWRLGKEKYARKFAYVLAIGKTPEQLLAEAEAELQAKRAEMVRLAAPKTVEQALNEIAKQHATPDTYMDDARKSLEQATAFVKEKGLLTLPTRANLQVTETPEFIRGIYAVGGFNPAPALEPQLGAFYWITPIPKTWSKDRIESKLREYNRFGLQQLTVHEAMPGHYVQFEYADDVQPQSRRVLRNVYGSGPYVEGWAFYTQQMMTDERYLGDQPGMRLTMLKQMLRGISNTILDVRLQTMGMTDQQALDLMIKDTYQEKEEATAKLQRAQLSSTQLPTYFAGWKAWLETREQFKQKQGSAYTLRGFHERALKESAVPMSVLSQLLE